VRAVLIKKMPALAFHFGLRHQDIPNLSPAELTAYLEALDSLSRR